jgi:hypothetical protein
VYCELLYIQEELHKEEEKRSTSSSPVRCL